MFDPTRYFLAWLVDAYAASAVVCLAAGVALRIARRPAKRMAVVWAAAAGLWAAVLIPLAPRSARVHLGWVSLQSERASADQYLAGRFAASSSESSSVKALPRGASIRAAEVRGSSNGGWFCQAIDALAVLWGCCLLSVFWWLSLGAWQARRLVMQSQPVSAEVLKIWRQVLQGARTRTRVHASGDVDQPVALGLIRPVILLPESMVACGDDFSLRAALAHEWTHIRRGDLWLLATFRWLSAALAFHPGYWRLRGAFRFDQEALADAAAAREGSTLSYAQLLLAWSQQRLPAPSHSGVGMAQSTCLKQRISLLLKDENVAGAAPCRWKWAMTGFASLAIAVPFVSLHGNIPLSNKSQVSERKPGANRKKESVDPARPVLKQFDLPSGLRLEVVGVQGRWRQGQQELVVRVSNPCRVSLDWKLAPEAVRSLGTTETGDDMYAILLSAVEHGQRYRLGVSIGGWRKRSTQGDIRLTPCSNSLDDSMISLSHQLANEELRVLAVDDCGIPRPPSMMRSSGSGLTATFAGLPLGLVEEFVVQSRYQAWIETDSLGVEM